MGQNKFKKFVLTWNRVFPGQHSRGNRGGEWGVWDTPNPYIHKPGGDIKTNMEVSGRLRTHFFRRILFWSLLSYSIAIWWKNNLRQIKELVMLTNWYAENIEKFFFLVSRQLESTQASETRPNSVVIWLFRKLFWDVCLKVERIFILKCV